MNLATTIKFYNTVSKQRENFKPIKLNEVGIYSCGPTVYDYAHIGNLRAYVFVDMLYRFLVSQGFKVTWMMNITDIDDKTINKAKAQNKNLKEITDKYEKAFKEDLQSLNISVDKIKFIRATEHFAQMKELVDKLLEKDYAYKADDGIYFDVSKYPEYGKFAGIDVNSNSAKSRINNDNYDKESAQDFALWKIDDDYPEGRPGWHIECSAMASKYLGQPFDIHTGGVDLIFPHHQNEIAQSQAAYGKPLANYWLHNEHLLVEGKKMAKSEGNYLTLCEVKDKGFSPLALRLELMKAHYRSKLDFSWKDLEAAQNLLVDLRRFYINCTKESVSVKKNGKDIDADVVEKYKNFVIAMSDDLNTPKALAVIIDAINQSSNIGILGAKFIKQVDQVLGLRLTEEIPQPIKDLVIEMDEARSNKGFEKSDKFRHKIESKGYIIENSHDGSYAIEK